MKTVLTALLLLATITLTHTQTLGNYQRKKSNIQETNSGNFNQFNQLRSVAKGATITGDNNLQISINALSNQRASSYTALLNVVQLGQTAEATNRALNDRIEPFIQALKSLGLSDEDIYVDMVNFVPKYEFDVSKKLFSKKTFKEIPIGFELQKNIHIRFTDPQTLDKIVTAAAAQEIYDIVKVDYFIDNPKSIYAELRTAALKYVNEIKTQYDSIGMVLDSAYLITGENAWVAYPGDRYVTYQGYSNQTLSQKQRVDAKVDKIDRPVSRFYDAIQPNDYDIVINPEILEPAIQFSYNLIVKFTLPRMVPRTITKTQKEFILVTPDGEVKTLKIE